MTRNGSEGSLIQYIKQNLTNPYMKNYYLCTIKDKIDGTTEDWAYNSDGTGYDNKDCPEYDIVSRYQEPINEVELNKLAVGWYQENVVSPAEKYNTLDEEGHPDIAIGDVIDAYMAGYKKAKNE